jgi:3-(3-hydroxy-phenyl)propionate hydroxylase
VLDSYDEDRRPHAKAMIDMAKLMGRLVMPRNKLAAFLIHGLMRTLALTPATRKYFEELQIKPKNIFRQGLFVPHRRGDKLVRGGLFPQAWVRNAQQRVHLSDEALGDHLTLVGFGVDPLSLLSPAQAASWVKLGGSFLHVGTCGQRPGGNAAFIEDLSHDILPLAPKGTLVVVRPDRHIMHHAASTEAARLVQTCMDLMASGDSTADSVSFTITEPLQMRA